MATGPEHYRKAERVLAQVEDRDVSAAEVAAYTAVAQVHATLAVAAACATGLMHGYERSTAWTAVLEPDGKKVTR